MLQVSGAGAQKMFLLSYYTFDVSIAFSFCEQTTHTTQKKTYPSLADIS